jgi:signal transduction histidine kinase
MTDHLHDETQTPDSVRAKGPAFIHSQRFKISLLSLAITVVVLFVSTGVGVSAQRERELSSMSLLTSQTGQVIEHILQRDMLVSDFDSIQDTFDDISQDERVRSLYLLDTQGNVIFAPRNREAPRSFDNSDPTCQPCHRLPPEERPSGVVITNAEGQRVFRSMHPVENRPECTGCHNEEERIIGLLLTDFSVTPIEGALATDIRHNLFWWIGGALLTVVLVNVVFDRTVLKRLRDLSRAMTDIGEGQPRAVIHDASKDEIGHVSASFNAMVQRLQTREQHNRALSQTLQQRMSERELLLKRLMMSQENERRRVARELHDDLGQRLSSTALHIELARESMSEEPKLADEQLEGVQTLIEEAVEAMHELIHNLRPAILDDLGLAAALHALCKKMLDPRDIAWNLHVNGLKERLPSRVETALYRIFQEALHNTLRHAGATRVDLSLTCGEAAIEAEIQDNGVGFHSGNPAQSPEGTRGSGLLSIRERTEQFGGQVNIETGPDQGTHIHLRIPLSKMSSDDDD